MTELLDWDAAYPRGSHPWWPATVEHWRAAVANRRTPMMPSSESIAVRSQKPTAPGKAASGSCATRRWWSADATIPTGYDARFRPLDSALSDTLPATCRDEYLDSMRRAVASGAPACILTFTRDAFSEDPGYPIPSLVSRSELGEPVSGNWTRCEVGPALIDVHPPRVGPSCQFDSDVEGREKLPAPLSTAPRV